ncbi:hypothetical protein HK105_207597 [Polyrhizophydium stewartii]|uniref:Uncharacterized protein n=1 Tax=Polyrhizophydium stewartii TaxID=2732419 RepID=A0ABR4N081_9FUNG
MLWLFDNRLSGSIPPSLAGLKQLQSLRISNNALAGTIPAGMGKIPTLFSFHFDGNANITGSLPDFAPTLDCSGAGTRSCLPKSADPAFCGLQYRDPSANLNKAPAAAELPSPSPSPSSTASLQDASSLPSSTNTKLIFVGCGVGVFALLVAIGVFVSQHRRRVAEKAKTSPFTASSGKA